MARVGRGPVGDGLGQQRLEVVGHDPVQGLRLAPTGPVAGGRALDAAPGLRSYTTFARMSKAAGMAPSRVPAMSRAPRAVSGDEKGRTTEIVPQSRECV